MHFFKKVWGEDSVGKIEKWFIFSINESTRIDWGGGGTFQVCGIFPSEKPEATVFLCIFLKII